MSSGNQVTAWVEDAGKVCPIGSNSWTNWVPYVKFIGTGGCGTNCPALAFKATKQLRGLREEGSLQPSWSVDDQ